MNYEFTVFFNDSDMSIDRTTQHTFDPEYHASELKRAHEKSGEKVIRVTFEKVGQ